LIEQGVLGDLAMVDGIFQELWVRIPHVKYHVETAFIFFNFFFSKTTPLIKKKIEEKTLDISPSSRFSIVSFSIHIFFFMQA
jgi:hypothetical protein